MVEYKFDKLYLAKKGRDSEHDVFIEKCPLVQHQLDGIRFLYKSLKKKRGGVVLNDPSCYGKRVQTALFISAILPVLDKSVLILCREGREQRWYNHFLDFTNLDDDIIEMTKPYSKKKVFIKTMHEDVNRREWSLLVVDDDIIHKNLIKSTHKADLKIWLTSSDLKLDLNNFSTFYFWIHPKQEFLADKFKADESDLRDVIKKRVMLDAFLEDTVPVLRREFEAAPFPKTQDSFAEYSTKKNKDATGTKIKRSKRKAVEKDTSASVPKKLAYTSKMTEEFEIGNLELFANDITTIKSTVIQFDDDNDSGNGDNNRVKNRIHVEEMEIESESDEDEIITNKKEMSTKRKMRNIIESDSDTDCEIADIKVNNNAEKIDIDEMDAENKEVNELESEKNYVNEMNVSNEVKSISDYKNHDIGLSKPHANSDKVADDCNDSENVHYSTDTDTVVKKDAINEFKIVNIPHENYNKSEDLFSTDFTTKPYELRNEVIESTTKVAELKGAVTDKKTPEIFPESSSNSFELKMKQIEEMTLKKFKGSLLDTIF